MALGRKSVVIGRRSEDRAAAYLEGLGYVVLGRNFRGGNGELDIIAEKNGVVYFVEVKARRGGGMVSAREAVTADKQQRLLAAAEAWLQKYRSPDTPCSFLLATLEDTAGGEPLVELTEDFLCW